MEKINKESELVVGDWIEGDEGYGPTVIELCYIGDIVIGKALFHNGREELRPRESLWDLSFRNWRKLSADEKSELMNKNKRALGIDHQAHRVWQEAYNRSRAVHPDDKADEAYEYTNNVLIRYGTILKAQLRSQEKAHHSSERIIALIGRDGVDTLFRDALSGFVTEPPPSWAQAWASHIGDGSSSDRLQDWVCAHLRRAWMTGIGAIEAAEQMIEESMSNGNLSRPEALEEVLFAGAIDSRSG